MYWNVLNVLKCIETPWLNAKRNCILTLRKSKAQPFSVIWGNVALILLIKFTNYFTQLSFQLLGPSFRVKTKNQLESYDYLFKTKAPSASPCAYTSYIPVTDKEQNILSSKHLLSSKDRKIANRDYIADIIQFNSMESREGKDGNNVW